MSGHCVEKISCSKCHSSDAKQVFEENGIYTAFCFSCHTYDPSPYGNNPPASLPPKITKTPEQIASELAEIATLSACDLPARALRKETLDYFGIKVAVSEEDGQTPTAHFYPYTKAGSLSGYKGRVIENKQFFAVGDIKGTDFFGWEQAIASGAKRLICAEGELDCASIFQALKDKSRNTAYADRNPAVVSLVNGASSAGKIFSDRASEIKSHFSEVILVFDQDKAGKEATKAAILAYPSAQVVALPSKDANQCLQDGKAGAMANAILFRAETPKNTRIVNGSALFQVAKKPAEFGIPYPWDGLTKLTRGIRFGETYYIGAAVKSGKSEIVNTLAAHLMVNHNLDCFLAKPEESNVKTVKLVLGKVAGKFFHDPNIPFDEAAWDDAAATVGSKLHLLDLYQHMGWQSLRQDIVSAAKQDGCKAIFIDPITNLTNGVSAGETNTMLQEIAQELSALAKDLDVVIFLFCHLKNPESGPPHERGGKVLSSQFAGSRAMARSCNLMLGIECNKDPDLPEELRNIRDLVILEDREFGAVGKVKLYWNKENGLFSEVIEH